MTSAWSRSPARKGAPCSAYERYSSLGKAVQTTVAGTASRAGFVRRHGRPDRPGGLGDRPLAEGVELVVGEVAHRPLVQLVVPHGRQRQRVALEVGLHRVAVPDRCGVDEDDVVDELGVAVEDEGARDGGTAVDHEDAPVGGAVERGDDGLGLVLERDRRGVGAGVEPGEGERDDVVAVVAQVGHDGVPRPRAEPETGDEDDLGAHGPTLSATH